MSHISIIMPIYNCADFVSKTLDSLLIQTHQDIDIICVNDGSTDCSEEVVNKYVMQDKRVRLVTQANGGPGKARNTGLDLAKGSYIMFCDSDDWYEPDMCAKMLEALESSKSDVVMCQTFLNLNPMIINGLSVLKEGLKSPILTRLDFLRI
jgi:glycosyltransferase involved in cell wall biosynthesis